MSQITSEDELFNEVLRLNVLYHREAKRCADAKAFLAGCIMIGAAFESMLLAFALCYADEATASEAAPRTRGTIKPFVHWSLKGLLAVAKECSWLPSGLSLEDEWDGARAKIGDYGEVLRQIRNLVHPARYASEFARKRITKRYLESSFEILYIASDYLMEKIGESLRVAVAELEEGDA